MSVEFYQMIFWHQSIRSCVFFCDVVVYVSFQVLSWPCIPGRNSTGCCVSLFLFIAEFRLSMFYKEFASAFMRDIGLQFSLWYSRLVLVSEYWIHKMEVFLQFFGRRLCSLCSCSFKCLVEFTNETFLFRNLKIIISSHRAVLSLSHWVNWSSLCFWTNWSISFESSGLCVYSCGPYPSFAVFIFWSDSPHRCWYWEFVSSLFFLCHSR